MNLTFGNRVPSIGRQINWKLIMLVGGLGIAISAATGVAILDRSAQPSGTQATASAASRAVPADFTGLKSTVLPTFYIVDSQQQANQLRANLASEQASTGFTGEDIQVHVMVGETASQVLNQEIAEDVANGGTGVNLIDLR